MAMKFHEGYGTSLFCETGSKIWKDKFTAFHRHIMFDNNTISELKKGLEFGILLKLPSDLSCNQHLCELVAKDQDEELRPFLHLS